MSKELNNNTNAFNIRHMNGDFMKKLTLPLLLLVSFSANAGEVKRTLNTKSIVDYQLLYSCEPEEDAWAQLKFNLTVSLTDGTEQILLKGEGSSDILDSSYRKMPVQNVCAFKIFNTYFSAPIKKSIAQDLKKKPEQLTPNDFINALLDQKIYKNAEVCYTKQIQYRDRGHNTFIDAIEMVAVDCPENGEYTDITPLPTPVNPTPIAQQTSWSCSVSCGSGNLVAIGNATAVTAAAALNAARSTCATMYRLDTNGRNPQFYFHDISILNGARMYNPPTVVNSCVKN